jgi:uncharacterized protein (DUF2132 family)
MQPLQPQQPRNPLHGITLLAIVEDLVARRGWDDLAAHIPIRCFSSDPSIQSSLKFLRKTEWARRKVEQLYLADQRRMGPDGAQV